MDLLEEKMGQMGAKQVAQPLRVDGDPDGSSVNIEGWAEEIVKDF